MRVRRSAEQSGAGFQGLAGNAFQPLINPSNSYQIIDNVSWIKGAHTLLFGIDLHDYRFSSTNSANSRGSFSFTGAFAGNAFADFLTGYPFSGARSFLETSLASTIAGITSMFRTTGRSARG